MRWILVAAAAVSLGGCVVTSETPLFAAQDATRHPLALGRWGLSGPGCEVAALKDLPECAIPMTITADTLDIDPKDLLGSPLNEMAGGGPVRSSGGPVHFLMADGDPAILQLLDPAQSPPKPGYMAVSPLTRTAPARSTRR